MQITINNWDKYNPRFKDVQRSSWFRLEHSLFENPDFYDFAHEEILVWIYLLCVASKKNGKPFKVVIPHLRTVGRLSEGALHSSVKKLEELQLITVSVTDAIVNVTDTITTRRTERTRRDDMVEQSSPPQTDLLYVLNKYGNKYPKGFIEQEWPHCVEWWKENRNKHPTSLAFRNWLCSEAGKKKLLQWNKENSPDPMGEYFEQALAKRRAEREANHA